MPDELIIATAMPKAQARHLQRQAGAGTLRRVAKGIYALPMPDAELALLVRRHWQKVAGVLVPGGVVSHRTAMKGGPSPQGDIIVSHPTAFNRTVSLPGLRIRVVHGPGPLPGDLPMGTSGMHYAGRARFLLENIGRKGDLRVTRGEVEEFLVNVLNASGEKALNDIRDHATALAQALGTGKALAQLREITGALLGTHARGGLKTRSGRAVARGAPVDEQRMALFEVLASHLRTGPVACIRNHVTGKARQHFAFIESYFSNYVEGTRFDIGQARDIVMHQLIVPNRPKDSHDILGVFRLAITVPYRDNPPAAGTDFVEGLQAWHAEMLKMRPEANPGQLKLQVNYAGSTRFVEPSHVRGTLADGSRLAFSVPEGLARAIYYAFLVSEVHPFEDGNGRLSRLVMNAELSRNDLCRIIIPTLFHPQYVDCARALTRGGEPHGFIRSLDKMARWTSQFDYTDLDALIDVLRRTNAPEESPAQFRLLNADGTAGA